VLNTYTIPCSIYRLCILQHSTSICSVGFSQLAPFIIPNSSTGLDGQTVHVGCVRVRVKSRKAPTVSSYWSDRPSIHPCDISSAPTGRICVKFHTGDLYEKSVNEIQISLKIRQKYWQLYAKHELSMFTLLTVKKKIFCSSATMPREATVPIVKQQRHK